MIRAKSEKTMLVVGEVGAAQAAQDAPSMTRSPVVENQGIRSASGGFDPLDDLMDKDAAAAFFRVSIRTLEKWMKTGLPHYKIHRSIRFRRRHLLNYLDSTCRK